MANKARAKFMSGLAMIKFTLPAYLANVKFCRLKSRLRRLNRVLRRGVFETFTASAAKLNYADAPLR